MPELLTESNVQRAVHLNSVHSAIAYLSAPEEVKERVEAAEEPVTEKQIKDWRKA